MEQYYDDSRVTLGDGSVNVEQGIHGVQKVAGSVSFVRDPRLSHLAQALADLPPIWKAPQVMAQLAPGTKWCASCGDIRPKAYFSPDKRNFDGLDHRCKGCEAERKRKGYQQTVGREVRAYARGEQATA